MELTCFDCEKFESNLCLKKKKVKDEDTRACESFTDVISGRAINRRTIGTSEETTCFSKGGQRWDREKKLASS